jgi:hypothetical protein
MAIHWTEFLNKIKKQAISIQLLIHAKKLFEFDRFTLILRSANAQSTK